MCEANAALAAKPLSHFQARPSPHSEVNAVVQTRHHNYPQSCHCCPPTATQTTPLDSNPLKYLS